MLTRYIKEAITKGGKCYLSALFFLWRERERETETETGGKRGTQSNPFFLLELCFYRKFEFKGKNLAPVTFAHSK